MTTNNRTGKTEYTAGSIGFMIQPSVNYYLSDFVSLNLGGYYMFQPFKNNADAGYRLTDGNGSYSSVQNNVTSNQNSAYGVHAGVRFFLGRNDRDKDGIPDQKDDCVDVPGLVEFNGCPDTDKDGIPDPKDSCVNVFGLAEFHGCPDSDKDGIQDSKDDCPFAAGPKELNGCPDRDKDGIADRYDLCPDEFGLAIHRGCPDTDSDGLPDKDDKCPTVAGPISNQGCPETKTITPAPTQDTKTTTTQQEIRKGDMTTPIFFEVNKSQVNESYDNTIDDAVYELNKNKDATILIDGHADSSGPEDVNKILSRHRAESVKAKLIAKGVNPNRLKVVGHGSDEPAESNDTHEGKRANRRVKMKLK
jgi:outer membrane protein OmpA-like peptidoglycan-associated protein